MGQCSSRVLGENDAEGQECCTLHSNDRGIENVCLRGNFAWATSMDCRLAKVPLKVANTNDQPVEMIGHTLQITALAFDTGSGQSSSENLLSRKEDSSYAGASNVGSRASSEETAPVIVYTASRDRSIRAWDHETGQCLFVYSGHTDWVTGLGCIGGKLWSCSHDGTVCQWQAYRPSLRTQQQEQEYDEGGANSIGLVKAILLDEYQGIEVGSNMCRSEENQMNGGVIMLGGRGGRVWCVDPWSLSVLGQVQCPSFGCVTQLKEVAGHIATASDTKMHELSPACLVGTSSAELIALHVNSDKTDSGGKLRTANQYQFQFDDSVGISAIHPFRTSHSQLHYGRSGSTRGFGSSSQTNGQQSIETLVALGFDDGKVVMFDCSSWTANWQIQCGVMPVRSIVWINADILACGTNSVRVLDVKLGRQRSVLTNNRVHSMCRSGGPPGMAKNSKGNTDSQFILCAAGNSLLRFSETHMSKQHRGFGFGRSPKSSTSADPLYSL